MTIAGQPLTATAGRKAMNRYAGWRLEPTVKGALMAGLLDTVIEAHGGLERWNQLDAISVHGVNGGALAHRIRAQAARTGAKEDMARVDC
jgi:hypothetical protein